MKKIAFYFSVLALVILTSSSSCDSTPTADQKLNVQQEQLMGEAVREVGMPNIKNFTQRKTLKWIQELCDQEKLVNYCYSYSDMTGKYTYMGKSYGYPIPFSTQYTNPEKTSNPYTGVFVTSPQADPNGLFMPSASEASWVILINPKTGEPHPVYSEPRLFVTPFPLSDDIVLNVKDNPKL